MFTICLLLSLINSLSAATSEYKVLNEKGEELGTFDYEHRHVKRDAESNSSEIVQEDNHKYYTSKVQVNKNGWIEISPDRTTFQKEVIHEGLSSKFRYAYNLKLPFTFPYYGLPLTTVTPTTGGFIYVGDLVHRRLTETQYIAPLMAEFNPSLGNDSYVYYYMDDSKAVIQWEKVHVHSMYKEGSENQPFTFQAQLHKNGDIIFSYRDVPYKPSMIDDTSHYVRVGLAEAFYEVDTTHGMTVTYIHQYHSIDMDLAGITNDSYILLKAEPTCMSSRSCADCTTRDLDIFECSWCHALQQCSDGIGRWRQQWTDAGCEPRQITDRDQCPNEKEEALPSSDAKTGHYEVILCQDSKTAVVCAGNDKLEIFKATFSRDNTVGSLCQSPHDEHGSADEALCAYDQNKITAQLISSCNGNRTCFVKAASEYFDVPDPCPGYDKTLNIYYKCNGGTSASAKVATAFVIIVVLCLVVGLVGWGVYAYRNPTTPSGLFLIKYGRFWKSNPYKDDSAAESRI